MSGWPARRAIASMPAVVSRQPRLPQRHSSPSAVRVVWPISPAVPIAPPYSRSSRIRPAPMPSRQLQVDDVGGARAGAPGDLGDGARVRVVLDVDGHAETLRHGARQVDARQRCDRRRLADASGGPVDRAGDREAGADQPAGRQPGRLQRCAHGVCDRVEHRRRAAGRRRARRCPRRARRAPGRPRTTRPAGAPTSMPTAAPAAAFSVTGTPGRPTPSGVERAALRRDAGGDQVGDDGGDGRSATARCGARARPATRRRRAAGRAAPARGCVRGAPRASRGRRCRRASPPRIYERATDEQLQPLDAISPSR